MRRGQDSQREGTCQARRAEPGSGLGRPWGSGPQGPVSGLEAITVTRRGPGLTCSLLFSQGLQGIQGPKVSSGAQVETPLPRKASRKPW